MAKDLIIILMLRMMQAPSWMIVVMWILFVMDILRMFYKAYEFGKNSKGDK